MFLRSTSGEGGSRYVLNLCPEDIKMRPARFPTETFYHLCRWKSLNVINSNVSTTRQSGRTRSELSRTNFFLQRSWKIVWRKLSVQIWERLKWGSVPRDNVVWMLCRRRNEFNKFGEREPGKPVFIFYVCEEKRYRREMDTVRECKMFWSFPQNENVNMGGNYDN